MPPATMGVVPLPENSGMTEHRVILDKRKREESGMADWRLVLY